MFNIIISIIILQPCVSKTNDNYVENEKLTSFDFNTDFIQLIPSKGIVLQSDSILLGKCSINNLITLIDTNDMHTEIKINKPKVLTISHLDSPSQGYTEENQHQSDEYFMNYSGYVKIEGLTFHFLFCHYGRDKYEYETYMDSLNLSKIRIYNKTNAGLYNDLKIKDQYEKIYNYYDKPIYHCNHDIIRTQHQKNGVIFTIGADSTDLDYYGKIKMIEINNLTKY